jgi:hypothetical protein
VRWRDLLFPSDERFRPLLLEQARIAAQACDLLAARGGPAEMARVEAAGDAARRRLAETLARTYATPWDRDDIFALSSALDDVADAAQQALLALAVFGGADFAHEIQVARRVDKVERLALNLCRSHRKAETDMAPLLLGFLVEAGCTVIHLASPVESSGTIEKGLCKCRLATATVAEEAYGTYTVRHHISHLVRRGTRPCLLWHSGLQPGLVAAFAGCGQDSFSRLASCCGPSGPLVAAIPALAAT